MSLPSSEQWRPVVGYEGLYEVSDQGRVRSLDRWMTYANGRQRLHRGRILSPGPTGRGYQVVQLCRDNTRQVTPIHRLVVAAFVGPCPPGAEVCHKNGDRADNRRVNLRYDTHSGNMRDAVAQRTHSQSRKNACPRQHLLVEPNLDAWSKSRGGRKCRSCHHARHRVWKAKRRGQPHDFETWADQYYARIMTEASH